MKLSPNIPTLVLALELAAASISANSPASLACIPKAVIASVTISETVPRLSPEAAARFSTPGKPANICCVSQPAIAMYFKPSAASLALNFVVAPISLASASNLAKSSPVAPEMAPTSLMAASKSMPNFVAAAPMARTGAVTFIDKFLPMSVIFCPASCSFFPTCSAVSPVSLSCFSNFSSSCSAFTTSRWKALYCSSLISPLRNCSLTCSWAVLRRSSFSRLFSTASARSFCF